MASLQSGTLIHTSC